MPESETLAHLLQQMLEVQEKIQATRYTLNKGIQLSLPQSDNW